MTHFPFRHRWVIVRVGHYTDISFGGRAPSSALYYRCRCGATKVKHKYGEVWQFEDLDGAP